MPLQAEKLAHTGDPADMSAGSRSDKMPFEKLSNRGNDSLHCKFPEQHRVPVGTRPNIGRATR
ncbi:hypothetical protein Pan189_19190 [Stratiformator vulcanicus]|uniref:Uncharacterized protein n=1 Tax=Stratiformator vulcanicus TaxID=2527980 RepID=A0A517R0W8_9PLAN|nr:hypothetical protein Pan189_19190 [Stratiformator vulcanicus]